VTDKSNITLRLRIKKIGPGLLLEAERAAILRALKESGGSAEVAAKALKMGRSTMYRKITELKITDAERQAD